MEKIKKEEILKEFKTIGDAMSWYNWEGPDETDDCYWESMCDGTWSSTVKPIVQEAMDWLIQDYMDKYDSKPAQFDKEPLQQQYNHLSRIDELKSYLKGGDEDAKNHSADLCGYCMVKAMKTTKKKAKTTKTTS